jgi:hypothetical protein
MQGVKNIAALAAVLGFLPGQGHFYRPPKARAQKQFTAFDQERLDRAAEKRERKALKRLALLNR